MSVKKVDEVFLTFYKLTIYSLIEKHFLLDVRGMSLLEKLFNCIWDIKKPVELLA